MSYSFNIQNSLSADVKHLIHAWNLSRSLNVYKSNYIKGNDADLDDLLEDSDERGKRIVMAQVSDIYLCIRPRKFPLGLQCTTTGDF